MLGRNILRSASKWRARAPIMAQQKALKATSSKGVSIDEYNNMPDDYIPPLMHRNESGMRHMRPLATPEYGVEILHDPLWNKGTAFTMEERDRLGLRGLLPPQVRTIEQQVARIQAHLAKEPNPEDKNMYLQDLANRNETLYFRTLVENIEEMAPLVYTPTVGVVCQQFGNQFRRTRGMFISKYDRGHMNTMMHNWPSDDVHVVVVTDGSRILGLGDLGANGMGIPIGKLALYCAAGGIAPHRVLPVTLDVGTNNEELLNDPSYLGIRERRIVGPDYYDMVDEFMHAVYARYPGAIVQFEDFETPKAVPLLERYRYKYRMFNDDIQGTGSVTLSGLLSACRNAGKSLKDIKVLCAGAGSAGLGVCEQIVKGMMIAGLSKEEAMSRFTVMTVNGALGKADGTHGDPNHQEGLTDLVMPWVSDAVSDGTSLVDTIKEFQPSVLLGLSTAKGIFNQEVLGTMAALNDMPIIMPMSNPTAKAECTAEEAYKYTNGKAVVATGSPFEPVSLFDKTFIPSQCNNMFIFPGVGLACSVSGVSQITDEMLYLAAQACTDSMTSEEIAQGRTFPDIKRIREVSLAVAIAVIEEGLRKDLCTKIRKKDLKNGVSNLVQSKMYFPIYAPLVHKRPGDR
jgi:malate dehydrogenase (oxaloacetate-decarboxylating)(NADP+)